MQVSQKPKVAIVAGNDNHANEIKQVLDNDFDLYFFSNGIVLYNDLKQEINDYAFILSVSDYRDVLGLPLKKTIDSLGFSDLPFFLVTLSINQELIQECIKKGITDVFAFPINANALLYRLHFFIRHPVTSDVKKKKILLKEFKMPFIKRVFDVLASGTALLLLSPLFLLIAFLIKIESKGPVFYFSYRVGTGYNIFKFYKFRSMVSGADAKLKELKHLNQYVSESSSLVTANPGAVREICELCEQAGGGCLQPLYDDKSVYCEKLYGLKGKDKKESAFIKIQDDPRVTKVGKFIRNTSIDELPQLWNVFIGDMSLVGNRPLPLYEAEKITTDKYALRFLGPAGITGLWQVEKRGRGAMSEDERLSLDNDYVKNFNMLFDVKIILRTIPALFKSENV